MVEKEAEKSEEKLTMTVEKLKRSLAAAKTWMTRTHTSLSGLLTDGEPDIGAIQDAVSNLEKRFGTFDEIQSQLEVTVPAEEMDECINKAADFRDSKLSVLLQGRKILMNNEDNVSTSASSEKSRSAESVLNVYLPKLDIGKFSGDVIEWKPFWEKFEALIGEKDIPSKHKTFF